MRPIQGDLAPEEVGESWVHLQGSLHLQPFGTVAPAGVVHTTPWLGGIHLSNRQGLGSVACKMRWQNTPRFTHSGTVTPQGHWVGSTGRLRVFISQR